MEARYTEGGIKSGRCLAQRDGQAPPLLLRLQKCAGVDERTGQQLRARSPAIVECPLGQPSFVHGKAFGLDQKASAVVIERDGRTGDGHHLGRSEEHTSELQSLMRISYAVFCLKKKRETNIKEYTNTPPQKKS